MNDAELLQSYTREGSETAFRSLVERHLPLVFGTARRVTGNGALAEEIAQTVFLLLAKKAPGLRRETILTGWLYRTTRFVAARALTAETRRKRREEEAATMQFTNDADPHWTQITPLLDDALGRLSETDRQALLHRFFEQRSLREVGTVLGVGEEAAKKRVARALDRLRTLLRRRGKEITVGALVMGLEAEASAAVPVALGLKISAGVVATGTATTVGLASEVLAAWRWAKLKATLTIGTGLVAVALLVPPLVKSSSQTPDVRQSPASLAAANRGETVASRTIGSGGMKTGTTSGAARPVAAHSITITVLERETGKPIPGATVSHGYPPDAKSSREVAATTDAQGRAALAIPDTYPNLDRMTRFNVDVKAADFCTREVSWYCPTGYALLYVTNDYTVRLDRPITVSGIVADVQGNPQSSIRVGAYGNDYPGYSSTDTQARIDEYSSYGRSVEAKGSGAIYTDWSGRFKLTGFPPDLKALVIEMAGPEDTRWSVMTPQASRLTIANFPQVTTEELRQGTARVVYTPGFTVSGVVVDSYGETVAGAQVVEAIESGNVKELSRQETSRIGRFTLPNRLAREIILTVTAPGQAMLSTNVFVRGGLGDLRLQLPPLKALLGRVVDLEGNPVAAARITATDYLNPGVWYQWGGTTDAEGRFAWTNAPDREVTLEIFHDTLAGTRAAMRGGAPEQVVTLGKRPGDAIKITVHAVDAESGQPIENLIGKLSYSMWNTMPEPARKTVRGADGALELTLSRKDIPIYHAPAWVLLLESEDHEPVVTRMYSFEEGDQTLEIKMPRGGFVQGTVTAPDGSAAAFARLSIMPRDDVGLYSAWRDLAYTTEGTMGTNDASGHFRLAKPLQPKSLVVMHETGWSIIPMTPGLQDVDVRLKPWARIEGVVLRDGQPVAKERVVLNDLVHDWSKTLQVMLNVSTDGEGRFVFPRVPAGEYTVSLAEQKWQTMARKQVLTYQTPVTVEAGTVVELKLASAGRDVAVQLDAGAFPPARFTNATVVLRHEAPVPGEPMRSDFVSNASHLAAHRKYAENPAVLAALREQRTYVGEWDGKETAWFHGVPAGRYYLEVEIPVVINGRPKRDMRQDLELAGRLRVPVEIPEAAAANTESPSQPDPVMLGKFTIPPQ